MKGLLLADYLLMQLKEMLTYFHRLLESGPTRRYTTVFIK